MNAGKLKLGIQRVNIFRMIFPVIFLIVIIFIAIWFPFFNCLFPTEVDSTKSATELYNSGCVYVKSNTGKLYYTGYDYLRGSTVKGHYYYALENGRCTIYLFSNQYFTNGIPDTIDHADIKAMLIHKPSNLNQLLTLMASNMNWTYDGLAACTDTVIVSQMNYAVTPSILIGIFTFFALSFSLGHILILMFNVSKPEYAYTFVVFGHHKSRKKYIVDAAQELADHVIFESENMYVTKNYFIYISPFNIAIIPVSHMAWAYKYSHLHKYYLFGEMSYQIRIYTKNKVKYTFRGKTKEAADHLLACLREQNEDMLIGYTYENRLHSKNIMHSIFSHLFK